MTTVSESTAATEVPASPGVLTHRQILTILSGLLLGMFLASLDQTIVSTAMKTIADKLNGQTAQAWVTTSYLVTSTVSTPLYGKLSDLYGRKPFYLFAIGIFVVGSVLCGTAQNIYVLAGYRALQGLGAGGLLSLAFAIVGDIVPPRQRGKYQAYFMSVFATSSVLGPVLGGFFAGQDTLVGIDGWRWIFYLNVPIGIAALLVVSRNLKTPRRRTEHRIDYLGAALLTAGIVAILLLAEKGRDFGWGSFASIGLMVIGVVSIGLFVPRERHMGEEAILPLRVFSNRVFSYSSAVSFLVGTAMFGGIVMLPLYLQIVKGESPTRSGLMLIPLMAGIIASSTVSGRVMMRTGKYKIFPIVGTAVMFTSMLLFSLLDADTPVWHAMVFMVVMGAGLGLSMQTLVISVQNALPPTDMGVATSSVTFFRSMGGTFGAALSLSILFGTVIGNIRDRAVAAGAPKALLAQFQQSASLNNTSTIKNLPDGVRHLVLSGFADSMHTVFLTVAVLLIPAFVLTLFIKEVPLRATSGLEAAKDDALARAESAAI